jgi:energy-coupling factor transporter ATP-binding protein EcfA2
MTKAKTPEVLYLKSLKLKNVRGFKDAELSFLDKAGCPRSMTLFVGTNGSGKSTLLRALGIGLCQQKEASALIGHLAGDFLRQNKKGGRSLSAEIVLELYDPLAPTAKIATTTIVCLDGSGQELLEKKTVPTEFPWERIFVCGYGVNRGTGRRAETPPSSYSRLDALATLYNDNAALLDPEESLRALKLDAQEKGRDGAFNALKANLRNLLELKPSHKIEVTSRGVTVHGPWGGLPFHTLGDGYRGTSGWFLDLCRRAMLADRMSAGGAQAGIVLIDEIDEHLHPSWQKKLVPLLRKRFPDLQFVGTTHSPMAIVNCQADELFLTTIVDTIATLKPLADPRGRSSDRLLRGEWFGLDSSADDETAGKLAAYHDAVRQKKPESAIAPLREAVREQLGYAVAPIDELAIEIAEEARHQLESATSPELREQRLKAAATLVVSRLVNRSAV